MRFMERTGRLTSLLDRARPRRRFWKQLMRRADGARDEGRYRTAAELYAAAIDLRPDQAGVHVQRGHMLKESGQFADAERAYRHAAELGEDAADLAIQLGHLFKVRGRWDAARAEYRRAAALRPGWQVAASELDALEAERLDRYGDVAAAASDASSSGHVTHAEGATLVPNLAPHPVDALADDGGEDVTILRFGRREYGRWGIQRTLRGIEAVHGYVLSATTLDDLRVIVNGVEVAREALQGPRPSSSAMPGRPGKYVFNSWIDVSPFQPGVHAAELRFTSADRPVRSWPVRIVVEPAEPEALHPRSDFVIDADPADPRSIEEQVRTRPSQVHAAERRLFPDGVRNLLVMRVDQLGDMVASVPALQRLRQLLPEARIMMLASPANADLARTFPDLVDGVIAVDFFDDPRERRRTMPLDRQRRLRDELHAYRFDIALDLARSDVSRELLLLSGARFLYGMEGEQWPFLSASISLATPDRWTGHDTAPHATRILAMVEALGTLLRDPAPIRRRADLDRSVLVDLGLDDEEGYVVLHTGARIGFSRWPHYGALIGLLLRRTGLKLVTVGAIRDLPDDARASGRVVALDAQLPFDQFDALLSFATVVVGNDSGPKHLAALRGVPAVTLFSARINWMEWGQEGSGVIISRKVPCAGCAIIHEPENCGKGFSCITDIQPEEVMRTLMNVMEARTGVSGTSPT